LDREGCQFGQGYLFGKPHGEQVATRLLERQWRFDRQAEIDRAASVSRHESKTAATVSGTSG
jgi:hypothetical protein